MRTGVLNLVSVGPGYRDLIAPQAAHALRDSDVIVGYDLYLQWIAPWIEGKAIHTLPLTQERERAQLALQHARAGQRVALVSSGDIGVYAMAALAFEQMDEQDTFDVRVTPGVTAANACASLLGSPLSHDFATLSLSDLLCPWQWIEQRATHIAQADLAVVLYNVQSRQRQEGVYKILRIMLEHKRADTWCGIVRNAYREGQHVELATLGELPSKRFDMLTTIVIGNRFTQRRRDWIFTPRGYANWDHSRIGGTDTQTPDGVPGDALKPVDAAALPADAIWVFAGTRDGNALARALVDAGERVVVSVASEYGADLARRDVPGAAVVAGRIGVERRRSLLRACRPRWLIDATHPYAADMSTQLIALSDELGIDYLRYERPESECDAPARLCDSVEAAARSAIEAGKRIFLATGANHLATFLAQPRADACDWYLRVTPDPAQVQRAIELGLPRDHVIAMQGPFSQALNEALWRDLRIDCVVSKASGDVGGYADKARAAASLGIPFIAIRRPAIGYPCVAPDFAAVFSRLNLVLSS